jgi:fatty-acyl-CoA synthase
VISPSSPIASHARRTPERCAITFRGVDISCAVFDARIRRVAGWLTAPGIGADDVLRAEREAMT